MNKTKSKGAAIGMRRRRRIVCPYKEDFWPIQLSALRINDNIDQVTSSNLSKTLVHTRGNIVKNIPLRLYILTPNFSPVITGHHKQGLWQGSYLRKANTTICLAKVHVNICIKRLRKDPEAQEAAHRDMVTRCVWTSLRTLKSLSRHFRCLLSVWLEINRTRSSQQLPCQDKRP